jgi:predicted alpha-1,6-mannanase (GH76 family)
VPKIRIYAIGDSDPQGKADVIRKEVLSRRGRGRQVGVVRFYDDSAKNVAAVADLQRELRPTKVIAVKIG